MDVRIVRTGRIARAARLVLFCLGMCLGSGGATACGYPEDFTRIISLLVRVHVSGADASRAEARSLDILLRRFDQTSFMAMLNHGESTETIMAASRLLRGAGRIAERRDLRTHSSFASDMAVLKRSGWAGCQTRALREYKPAVSAQTVPQAGLTGPGTTFRYVETNDAQVTVSFIFLLYVLFLVPVFAVRYGISVWQGRALRRMACDIPAVLYFGVRTLPGSVIIIGQKGARFDAHTGGAAPDIAQPDLELRMDLRIGDIWLEAKLFAVNGSKMSFFFTRDLSRSEVDALLVFSKVPPVPLRMNRARRNLRGVLKRQEEGVAAATLPEDALPEDEMLNAATPPERPNP